MTTTWIRSAAVLSAALLTVTLAACGSKPPECNDPQVAATAKDIVLGEVRKSFGQSYIPNLNKAQVDKAFDVYVRALEIKLSETVSNGYSSDTTKRSCAASLTAGTPGKDGVSMRAKYTLQAIADGDGNYYMEIGDTAPLVERIVHEFAVGVINGQISLSTSRPQVPEAVPVASLDLVGVFNSRYGTVHLSQSGHAIAFNINSVMDDSSCNLEGQASLSGLVAKSGPISKDNECEVSLKFGSPGTVEVKTNECNSYCGMKAMGSMDDTYRK